LILSLLATAAAPIYFKDLGLSPVALPIGPFFGFGPLEIKWYSLGYLAGILLGYLYLIRLLREPGAPMARRHADDFIFYATLGIILGGRLGYVLFYDQQILLHPLDIFKLWNGGMSLHGGTLGVIFAIWWMTRREKLSFLRFCDYIACVVPFGLGLVRLANFVNGELWGKVTSLSWGIVFPNAGPLPRHPSQLYEAVLEGPVMFAILFYFFWRTRARYEPGKLFGIAALSYGLFRFGVEFVRESDVQLMAFAERTGLHMGQWLTLPMIFGGLYLIATAKKRAIKPLPATATGEGSAA
jgi:phosphatidylglycerol---prolipoprotein diacylglyceryl transferase